MNTLLKTQYSISLKLVKFSSCCLPRKILRLSSMPETLPKTYFHTNSTILSQSDVQPLSSISGLTFLNLKRHIPSLLNRISFDELNFETTDDGKTIVYTDGSCLNNNKTDMGLRKSGIGVYWGRDNHPLNVSIPHGGSKLTSSRAEIAASHAAILLAKAFKIEKLLLHTDSDTLVKSCNHWLPMWQHNDWKSRSTNRPILNQDMWKKLTEDLLHVLVDFHHSSDCIEGIKKAHKLAQEGANAS